MKYSIIVLNAFRDEYDFEEVNEAYRKGMKLSLKVHEPVELWEMNENGEKYQIDYCDYGIWDSEMFLAED